MDLKQITEGNSTGDTCSLDGSRFLCTPQQLPIPTALLLASTDRKLSNALKDPQKQSSCVFCKGSHVPTACDAVKDTQKCIDIVRRNMLCFNCLGRHKISLQSKYHCQLCNHRHHTSICTDSPPAVNPVTQRCQLLAQAPVTAPTQQTLIQPLPQPP